EVDSRLEQLFHRDDCHAVSSLSGCMFSSAPSNRPYLPVAEDTRTGIRERVYSPGDTAGFPARWLGKLPAFRASTCGFPGNESGGPKAARKSIAHAPRAPQASRGF